MAVKSDFSVFIEACKPTEPVKVVASERIKQDGVPVEWEVVPISPEQNDAIRKQCTKVLTGKRGKQTEQFNNNKYMATLAAACTVYPPVNEAEFQDAVGVMGADKAIQKILLPGEFDEYCLKVMEINGFDLSMDDLIDEAKN